MAGALAAVSSIRRIFAVAISALGLVGVISAAQAGNGMPPRGPNLPFDKLNLAFNDLAARLPANRITRLVARDNTLGTQVLLTNGLLVYFPDGMIVSSEFRDRLPARLVTSGSKKLEAALGATCAAIDTNKGRLELRRTQRGVLSLVSYSERAWDPLVREELQSFSAVSAMEPRFLGTNPVVYQLVGQCNKVASLAK